MFKKILLFLALILCPVGLNAEPLNLNQILEATCRVRAGNASGSGTCIMEDQGNYYFLTNAHVVGSSTSLAIEMFQNGKQSRRIPGRVVWKRHQGRTDVDFAIIRVAKSAVGKYIPRIIPVAPDGYKISQGQYIASAGCPQARWANAWEGHATTDSQSRVLFVPPPLGGQSGSGIHVYIKDPSGEWHTRLGAVLTWSIGNQGGAIPSSTLYAAIKGRVFKATKIPRHWREVEYAIHRDKWVRATDGNYYKVLKKADGRQFARFPAGVKAIKWGIECTLCDAKGVQCPGGNCPGGSGGYGPPPRDGGGGLPVPPSRPPSGGGDGGIPDIGSPWPPKPSSPLVDTEKEKLKKDVEELQGKNKELSDSIGEFTKNKKVLEDAVKNHNITIEKLRQDIADTIEEFKGLTAKDKEIMDSLNADLVSKNKTLRMTQDALVGTQKQLVEIKKGLEIASKEFESLKKHSQHEIDTLKGNLGEVTTRIEEYTELFEQAKEDAEVKNEAVEQERDWWRYGTGIAGILGVLGIGGVLWGKARPIIQGGMDKVEDKIIGDGDLRKIVDGMETRLGDRIDEILKKKDNEDEDEEERDDDPSIETYDTDSEEEVEIYIEIEDDIEENIEEVKEKPIKKKEADQEKTRKKESQVVNLEVNQTVVNEAPKEEKIVEEPKCPQLSEQVRQFMEMKEHQGEDLYSLAFLGTLYKEAVELLGKGKFYYKAQNRLQGQEKTAEAIEDWVSHQFFVRMTKKELAKGVLYIGAMTGFLYQEAVSRLKAGEFKVLGHKATALTIQKWVEKEYIARLNTGIDFN